MLMVVKQRVRRRLGEEMLPECTVETIKFPESVMIWSCVSAKGVGRLHVVDKKQTIKWESVYRHNGNQKCSLQQVTTFHYNAL